MLQFNFFAAQKKDKILCLDPESEPPVAALFCWEPESALGPWASGAAQKIGGSATPLFLVFYDMIFMTIFYFANHRNA